MGPRTADTGARAIWVSLATLAGLQLYYWKAPIRHSDFPQTPLPEDQLSWTGSKEWTKESQGLAAGLAASAANAFHEEIAVKAFISVVSKAPGKALPRAGTLTCRIRFKLQLAARASRAEGGGRHLPAAVQANGTPGAGT